MATVAESVKAAADMNREGSGYMPAERPPALPQTINDNRLKASVFRRFILPPFNSDPDTLRQFEDGSPNPKLRVWPVPNQSGSNTVINEAASLSSSSSSGSSTSTGLAIKTATLSTGLIAVGGSFVGSVAASKSFQLISVTSSAACEIRFYGSGVTQSFDLSRATDAPPQAEIIPNIITDVVLDTLPFTWPFQNVIGANQDATQTTALYTTVINTGTSVINPTISIAYIPLEA